MKRKKPLISGNQCIITKFFKTAEIQSARTNSPIKKFPPTPSSSSSLCTCSTPARSQAKPPTFCGTPDLLLTPGKSRVSDSPLTVHDLTLDSSDSDSDVIVENVISSQGSKSAGTPYSSDVKVIDTQKKKRLIPSLELNSASDIEVIDTPIQAKKRIKLDEEVDVLVSKSETTDSVDSCIQSGQLSEWSQESLGSQSWVKEVKITDVKSVTDLSLATSPRPSGSCRAQSKTVVVDSEFSIEETSSDPVACEIGETSSDPVAGDIGETSSDPVAVVKCEGTSCDIDINTKNSIDLDISDTLNSLNKVGGESECETLPALVGDKTVGDESCFGKHTDLNDNFFETSYLNEADDENMRGYGGRWDDQAQVYPNQRGGFNQRGGHGFQRSGRGYNQGWSGQGRGTFPDRQQAHGGFDYRGRGRDWEGQQHDGSNRRRDQNDSYWTSDQRGNRPRGGPERNHQSGSYWESNRGHNRFGASNSHKIGLHHSQSYDHSTRQLHQSQSYDHSLRHHNKSDGYWCRDDKLTGSRTNERGKRRHSGDDQRQHGDDRHGRHRDDRHDCHGNERYSQHGDETRDPHRDDRHSDDGQSQSQHDQNKRDEKCDTKKKLVKVEAVNDSNDTEIAKRDSKSPTVSTLDKQASLPSVKVEEASESPVKKGISNLKKLFASSPKASLLPSADDSRSKPSSPAVGDMAGGVSPGSSSWDVDERATTPEKIKMETSDAEAQNSALDLPSQIRKLKVEESASPKSRSLLCRDETSFKNLLAWCGVDKSFATGMIDDESNVGTITKAVESMKVKVKSEEVVQEEEDYLLLVSSDESDDDLMRPSAVAIVKSLEDACKPLPQEPDVKDDIKVEPSTSAPSRKTAAEPTSNLMWNLKKLLEEKREKESDRGREMSAMEAELKQGLKNGGLECMELDESSSQETGGAHFEADQQKCLEKLQYVESILTCHPGEDVFHSNKCHQIFTFPGNMTLNSCGFTIAKSKIDKHMIRFDKIGKLLDFVKSDFIDMCFKNISSQDAFLTWVFYTMSVVDNTYTVEDLYKLLYIVWTKKNSVNWVPTVRDVAKVLVNYGADLATLVPTPLTVDFTEADLKSSEGKENEGKTGKIMVDNRTGYGRSNLLHVIQTVTLAVQKRPGSYTSDDLSVLFVMMSKVALDKSLTIGQVKFDVRLCFSAILNAIPNDEWHQRVNTLCGYLSILSSHHHNKVQLVRHILNSDPRGIFLQRRLAYTMLHQLFKTQEEQNITEIKVQMLHNFTISLCRDPISDYYLLSSIIILLDQCVGKETLPSSEKPALHTLHEHIRHLMGTIRDTIHNMDCTKVKNMLVQVDAKWNFMLQGMGTKQATLFHWTNMVSTVSTHQVEQPMEDVSCSQSDDEETPSETKT